MVGEMTTFLLMRHGHPDYSSPRRWETRGWGSDLAPLSEAGVEQVTKQLGTVRAFDPEIVITSPMTRALQTALVLRQGSKVPFNVEFDLHEWVPDKTFQWRTLEEIEALESDYERCHGVYPAGEIRLWETTESVRRRVFGVLRRYHAYSRVLAISHAEVIKAVVGVEHIDLAGVVNLELER